MTRPMPGTPACECDQCGECKKESRLGFRHPDAPCDSCPFHTPAFPNKRLTDAECAAEFWHATARAQFIDWAPNDLLGIDVPADGQWYGITRPDPEPMWTEAETWHRFVTYPNAFEGDHT